LATHTKEKQVTVLYSRTGTVLGVLAGALLLTAGTASAQDAARDVQQAAVALPSAAETCLQAAAPGVAQRLKACSDVIASGQLGGRDLPMAYLARAGAYAVKGDATPAAADDRRAIAAFGKIMDAEAPDPDLLFLRGTAYHALGDADAALADYDLAIRLSPSSPIAFIDRGILLAAYKQEYLLSIMDFDRALTLAPDNLPALTLRADSYARSGDIRRALTDYDRVLALSPQNAQALAGRATLQVRQ
jgi:tetratricopeptide (TPR) repeat protein